MYSRKALCGTCHQLHAYMNNKELVYESPYTCGTSFNVYKKTIENERYLNLSIQNLRLKIGRLGIKLNL